MNLFLFVLKCEQATVPTSLRMVKRWVDEEGGVLCGISVLLTVAQLSACSELGWL